MGESTAATLDLEIRLGTPGEIDAEALDELTAALWRELLEVGSVQDVARPGEGPAPPGAKGLELMAVGSLLVTLVKSAGGLQAVTGAIQAWLSGQPKRSVTLTLAGDTIVVAGLSSLDQERLITTFIDRHAQE
jgi:hypothetical protein